MMKIALGKDVEWIFCDSMMEWQPIPGSTDPLFAEPDPMLKALAKGKPLLWWYSHGNTVYRFVDEGVANLRKIIEDNAPIDVVISFSQGSNCMSLLLNQLRKELVPATWRLSVYLSGGQIDDP